MNKDESKNTMNILYDKIKNTKRVLKNDIKIINIFRQINKDSNKDLDKILQLSNQRIKCAKKGNNVSLHLKKYFDKEIKVKNSLSSKIIYIKSNDINEQKNKFNKSKINVIEKNKEMKIIFDKIRNDINPSKNINKYFALKNSKKKQYIRYNSTIGKEAVKNISMIINDEQKRINNKIDDYLKFTKYFEDKNINRLEKKNIIDLKSKNISNSFGFLEYNKNIEKKGNNKNNLIPYIKSKILENLTQTLNSKDNKNNKSNFENNTERIDLNNKYKKKDSLCIVKSEISNSDSLKHNYLKKMLRFDELINSSSLPSLDDYSTIISDKRRKQLLKKKKNKPIKIHDSERKTINDNCYNEKFYDEMENIYKEKNKELNKENELNIVKMKKNEIKDKKNDTIYLTQVHSKKSSNISDLFTSREKEINDNNNNSINRFLKNENYNKDYFKLNIESNNKKNIFNNNNIIRLKKIV